MTGAATAAQPAAAGTRWWIVALLATALFINYVDRGTVPTAAHLIQDDLGFPPRELGLLMSAFFWCYAPLQPVVGWLADRFGAQRVLGAGLALWACATMLVGLVSSFAALLALRILLGIGESVGFPSVSKLLATVVPVKSLGLANGIVAFGYLFGPAVGSLVGGMLMASHGWRSAFWVFGALSLLWLIPWSRVRIPAQPVAATGGGGNPPWRALLARRELWGTSLGLFSVNYAFYFTLTWLPYYVVREHGFSTEQMAWFTFCCYCVHASSGLIAGWLIDRHVRAGHANLAYKSVMAVTHLGFVGCMVCIALAQAPWAALGAILLYQVLDGANSPGVFAIPQILAGPGAAGRWVGVENGIGNLAGVIAPALTGLLVERSQHFTSAFLVAAAVSVLGVVGWVLMIPKVEPLEWPGGDAAQEPSR